MGLNDCAFSLSYLLANGLPPLQLYLLGRILSWTQRCWFRLALKLWFTSISWWSLWPVLSPGCLLSSPVWPVVVPNPAAAQLLQGKEWWAQRSSTIQPFGTGSLTSLFPLQIQPGRHNPDHQSSLQWRWVPAQQTMWMSPEGLKHVLKFSAGSVPLQPVGLLC